MKKLFLVLAASALVFSFSSCKKDYTCECSVEVLGTKTTQSYELKDQKKKDAEDACEGYVSKLQTGVAKVKCELK